MKTKHLLLLVLIAAFSSCSSAYRIGQTPDDVYYSPAPPPPVEYVSTDNQQDKDSYAYNNTDVSEDVAIRRGINDARYRGNVSLDYGFGYNPYDYYGSSLYSPYSSFYNPYVSNGITFYSHGYNYYNGYNSYSPFSSSYYPLGNYYYSPVYIYGHSSLSSNYSGPRTYNLGAYTNTASGAGRINNQPAQPIANSSAQVPTFPTQPVNRSSGLGNFIRRVFTPSDNDTRTNSNNNNTRSYNNDNNNSTQVRTIQTNTSSSSSSSSSGNSSAPVRTFRK